MNENPLISVSDLSKTYTKQRLSKPIYAVRDISFSMSAGEILGIVGESGCGKSTLARCMIRLITPTGGTVTFDGKDLTKMTDRQLMEVRPRIQMVFQNPYSSFNPKLTIGKSLRAVATFYQMKRESYMKTLRELLETTGLEEEWLNRRPGELSGGQLQRFAIVRALLTRPDLLIADEAVSALDVSVQAQILNLLSDLREKFGLAILFISHDLSVVRHICDRVLVMYLGKMMELGTAHTVMEQPAHPYTRALIAASPRLRPDLPGAQVLIQGDVGEEVPEGGCPFSPRCREAMAQCQKEMPTPVELTKDHWVACLLCGMDSLDQGINSQSK